MCGGFFGGGGSGFKPYSTYSTKGKSQRFFRYVDIAGTSVGLSVQTDYVFDIYIVSLERYSMHGSWFLEQCEICIRVVGYITENIASP